MKRAASLALMIGTLGAAALLMANRVSSSAAPPARDDPLARFIRFEEGDCPPPSDFCRCGLVRSRGRKCLFEVVYEADGSAVPGGRLYAATLDCGDCLNNDPPTQAEKAGAVILRGPRHPEVESLLRRPYDDLIFWVKKYRRDFGSGADPQIAEAARAEQLIAEYMRRIAGILIDRCIGSFYNALTEAQRIPLESFVFSMDEASAEGAAMETDVQFAGARLLVYSDCFYDSRPLQPKPEIFCAGLLHEIYHWQQEQWGAGASEIQRCLYELACTEKMRLNSFYLWMLGMARADAEFNAVQRDAWIPRFQKEWAGLDRAGRKAVAGWAWSRGGVNDATPEDALMRNLMYFRNGWMPDFWEALFAATELKIIRLPFPPLGRLP